MSFSGVISVNHSGGLSNPCGFEAEYTTDQSWNRLRNSLFLQQ